MSKNDKRDKQGFVGEKRNISIHHFIVTVNIPTYRYIYI